MAPASLGIFFTSCRFCCQKSQPKSPNTPTWITLLSPETGIALIDSKMWADGVYWWDNKQLFRNGRELKAFVLGAGVEALRAAYPGYVVEDWTVLHSPTGRLSLPSVERADIFPLPGRAPIRLVTPLELVSEVHAFLAEGVALHTVQVPALAGLLRSML
ncbi:hypothetical protein [Arthrobacter sp. AFG7.2]|uniref:hypothetical protein n=1 Tax=Arthrobacter sp. AFG7.2 TaxID=1688693 RepID=UPI0011AEE9A1|nr:hypothetical protein [Arthrobacter sp. AFG7.2]